MVRDNLPPGSIAAIYDTSGIIAARTRGQEQFVGRPGLPGLVDMMTQTTSGFVEGPSLKGILVYSVFSRSEVSNWAVSIGVPAAGLNHDLYTSLELTCAAALLLLVIAIGLAGYQSNQITSEVQALIAPAIAFARGEMPTIPRLCIREVGEVAQALDRAHQVLQRRIDERDRAEREKEVAESAARLKGEFIGTVSHEPRTPLTSITASLGLLNGTVDVNRSDATNRLIAIAHANSQRLVAR